MKLRDLLHNNSCSKTLTIILTTLIIPKIIPKNSYSIPLPILTKCKYPPPNLNRSMTLFPKNVKDPLFTRTNTNLKLSFYSENNMNIISKTMNLSKIKITLLNHNSMTTKNVSNTKYPTEVYS